MVLCSMCGPQAGPNALQLRICAQHGRGISEQREADGASGPANLLVCRSRGHVHHAAAPKALLHTHPQPPEAQACGCQTGAGSPQAACVPAQGQLAVLRQERGAW